MWVLYIQEEIPIKSKSPSIDHQAALDNLHEEIDRLEDKVKRLEERSSEKDEANRELG